MFLRFSQKVRLSRDFLPNRDKKHGYDWGPIENILINFGLNRSINSVKLADFGYSRQITQ